jgi:hypothetical protein
MTRESRPGLKPVLKYTGVPLRDLVTVFEAAARGGLLPKVLEEVRHTAGADSADVLVPDDDLYRLIRIFRFFGICTGIAGTWTPTLATLTVTAATTGTGASVAFSYLTASADPPCTISISSVTVSIAGAAAITVIGTDTPVAGGGSGTYSGSINSGGGPPAVGSAATVTVTFSGTNNGWCNTCTLVGAAAVTGTTTVV